MANLSAISAGLATNLATIGSLRNAYDVWPSQIITPCAIVCPMSMDQHQSLGTGANIIRYEVVVLGGSAQTDYARSQEVVNAYLDDSGASAIRTALESDKTLSGAATTCHLNGWRDYGIIRVNDVEYMGVKCDVEVWA